MREGWEKGGGVCSLLRTAARVPSQPSPATPDHAQRRHTYVHTWRAQTHISKRSSAFAPFLIICNLIGIPDSSFSAQLMNDNDGLFESTTDARRPAGGASDVTRSPSTEIAKRNEPRSTHPYRCPLPPPPINYANFL